MPPKRKAAAAKTTKAKKAKAEAAPEPEPETLQDKIAQLKAADKGKVKTHKPDTFCPISSPEVYEDYDAMLNQTNIGHNNNKFYVIQVLEAGGKYYAWNRWGRVGEDGQNSMKGPFPAVSTAIKDFEKKFQDKTRNKWANRASFAPLPGKYTLLDMAGEGEDDDDGGTAQFAAESTTDQPTAPCSLDKATQYLINLIFDTDMFKQALQKFDIDVKKMPLGKLSKAQIAKGFEVLEELEDAIEKGENAKFAPLTSKFYTVIPHSFGRSVPPVLSTVESIQRKYDMLAVLGDIEIAQSIQKNKKGAAAVKDANKAPHPLDINYELLNCGLTHVDKKSEEYKIFDTYFNATSNDSWRPSILKDIWAVDRQDEGKRFSVNDKLDNRKLLWHGTNVAVVTAILKTGLRIMPHSGGRVGRGIYFASEYDKSAGYVGSSQGNGILFLNEVALGTEKKIMKDNSSLKVAPPGYDSVHACGTQEPDSKLDTSIKLDDKTIVVPQGKPRRVAAYTHSSFHQSEYLVYREDQCRIRYLLLFGM